MNADHCEVPSIAHFWTPLRAAWAAVLLLGGCAASPALAQVPDTTRADTLQVPATDTLQTAPGDSVQARLDTTARQPQMPPLSYAEAEPGTPVHDVLPILQPALDAPELLADVPGSFVYDFGTPGWPDGWCPQGLSPQRVTLVLGGLPFDDPVIGRPRYDLLPLAFLEPLRLALGRYGAPYAVYAQPRPYLETQPLTELRYRTRANGLQSIMALHVQRRPLPLFGYPGVVQILGGYGGHASDGEYPGSRLTRMRQLYGRLRYAQPRWSVELSNLHNRRHIGAHGGVIPPSDNYESIYIRFGAQVRNQRAQRQTLRNDLAVTTRVQLLPLAPLTLTTYWTAQTFRYLPGTDTLQVKTNRYGARLYQDVRLGSHRLRLQVEGFVDRLRQTNALPDSLVDPAPQLHATVRDSLHLLGVAVVLEGALHATEALPALTGSLHLSRGSDRLRVFADAAYAGQPVPWVVRYGFGALVQPLASLPTGRVLHGRIGFSSRFGAFDATLFGFGHRIEHAFDYFRVDDETIAAHMAAPAITRVGAAGDIGWRRTAQRGFYLTLQPTFSIMPDADAPSDSDGLNVRARLAASLPDLFVRGRLGARYVIFQGDLDLDVYLQGRFWSPFRSRTFHAPTGLLALPPADARRFGPSGTLDLFVEAGIRTATVFLAYENMLSGTDIMAGTLLVPDYPLPDRRFRIGVYWPIRN